MNYDTMRFEAQQHMSRRASEAAAERLARTSAPVHRLRWLRRVYRVGAIRLAHSAAQASVPRTA